LVKVIVLLGSGMRRAFCGFGLGLACLLYANRYTETKMDGLLTLFEQRLQEWIVETNIALVKFQEGADIKVITSITEKYDDAIVARRDRGISKPKDLEGKMLAILPGTISHRFADLFIDFYSSSHMDHIQNPTCLKKPLASFGERVCKA
jgi:NMT1/THI5 like